MCYYQFPKCSKTKSTQQIELRNAEYAICNEWLSVATKTSNLDHRSFLHLELNRFQQQRMEEEKIEQSQSQVKPSIFKLRTIVITQQSHI